MKNKKALLIGLLLLVVSITFIFNAFAHQGRTDGSGGHRDNNNSSGLGSYHYHCGGYPAHLHTNEVCPYKSASSSTPRTNKPTLEDVNKKYGLIASDTTVEFDKGYQDGYNDGDIDGYDRGHIVGYDTGYEDGYVDGYRKGFYDSDDVTVIILIFTFAIVIIVLIVKFVKKRRKK